MRRPELEERARREGVPPNVTEEDYFSDSPTVNLAAEVNANRAAEEDEKRQRQAELDATARWQAETAAIEERERRQVAELDAPSKPSKPSKAPKE